MLHSGVSYDNLHLNGKYFFSGGGGYDYTNPVALFVYISASKNYHDHLSVCLCDTSIYRTYP